MNKTVLFTYDTAGNITERCEYSFTSKEGEALEELACTHYSYDYEGDRLVNYNGESIAYNVLGNPTSYRGNAVEWQYGNRLTKYGTTTFAYDGAGRRVSKGSITFTYDSAGNLIKQSDGLEFVYDNSGVIGLKYSGNTYFYRRDCQGNIIALIDNNGAVVVEYKYDAWGNHEAMVADETYVALAEINPFRYRGYYYDSETDLYFLQTRYYDPEVGRFISRDSIEYAAPETICGLNLYAYCSNNPVMNVDPTGHGAILQAIVSILSYIGIAIVSIWNEDVRNDMNAIGWNPFNSNAQAVLNSQSVSFYKGVPVFRTNMDRPGSFCIILLNENANINTVKHEWGHNMQMMTMGAINYLLTVGIMSPLELRAEKWGNYYKSPWETGADYLGGVQGRSHLKNEISRAIWYIIVGSIFPPAAYLFLI